MDEPALTVDPLFLACTRPAMWQGVPIEAAAANMIVTMFVFILMKNPLYMTLGVAIHYAARAFISHDYNWFGTVRLWIDTKGRARNAPRWGGSSVSPLPLGPARAAQEVRVHV